MASTKDDAVKKPGGKGDADEKDTKPAEAAVSFLQLLRTADWLDWLLMLTGTVCAMATGAVQPWCASVSCDASDEHLSTRKFCACKFPPV